MDEIDKLEKLTNEFINSAIICGQATRNSDYKLNNKHAKIVNRIFMKIKEEDESTTEKFFERLMKSEEINVRELAAAQALKVNILKVQAIDVLTEISKMKDVETKIISFNARMVLEMYYSGKFGFEENETLQINRGAGLNEQSDKNFDLIYAHVEKYIGKIDSVLHENVSDDLHVDILHVKPTAKRNYHTFVTSGMSSRPMKVPNGVEGFKYCELMITLPPDWLVNEDDHKDEKNYWPIRCLKQLSRLPHEQNTWLGYGHTIPNGNPEKPYSNNTDFCCMLLTYPVSVIDASDFIKFRIDDDKSIIFYCLIPIYREETKYKLKKGSDSLLNKFDNSGVNDIIYLNRKNVCR